MKIPQENTSNFENVPAGTYPARCYRFIDIGSHPQEFQGESKGNKRLILLSFEMTDEKMEDGKPFTISKRYTWSMHEKSTLRKHLEAWRGAKFQPQDFGNFDIRNVIGTACILTIGEWSRDDKSGTSIESITKIMKGMEVPEMENTPFYFSLEPDEFDADNFDTLSDSMKETIRRSPEWAALHGQEHAPKNNSVGPQEVVPLPSGPNDYGQQVNGY